MTDDPQSLIAEAYRLPGKSRAATALLARAARLADTLGDDDEGFRARIALIQRCFDTGEWSYIMPAFGWCVAQHDRDPERFRFRQLAWYTKWVIGQAIDTPSVSKATLVALLDDAERRYVAAGFALRPIHLLRANACNVLGDPNGAIAAHKRFFNSRRDQLADCIACEASNEADVLRMAGQPKAAVGLLKRAVQNRYSCHTQPERTYAYLTWWTRERPPADVASWRASAERVFTYEGFYSAKASLLSALADAEAWAKLWRAVERDIAHVAEEHRASASLGWYASVAWSAKRHLEVDPEAPAVVITQVDDLDGEVSLAELAAWATARFERLAAAFDRRAGNTFMTDDIRAQWP